MKIYIDGVLALSPMWGNCFENEIYDCIFKFEIILNVFKFKIIKNNATMMILQFKLQLKPEKSFYVTEQK